ncbi:MAG: hypothetical protein V5A68_00720, partial [Candidatus Thermoplasmatota archaeon]
MDKMKNKNIFTILIATILLSTTFIPIITSEQPRKIDGYEKGASYTNIKPLKKTTLIQYNEQKLIDDYAYLASVPTSIYKHGNLLYSNPLLFYKDEYKYENDKERSLNSRQGLDYFMEDWMSYCNGKMDQKTLINIPEGKTRQWDSKKTDHINSKNTYELASKIALKEWSYSKDVVVAPAEEKDNGKKERYTSELEGEISNGYDVEHKMMEMQEPEVGIGGNYKSFEVQSPAKYIVANLHWENLLYDYDFQLYDSQLGMAGANSKWNILYDRSDGIPNEPIGSYIYNYGKWEAGITYMPTQSSPPEGKMEKMYQNIEEETKTSLLGKIFNRDNMLPIDIYLYPGVEIKIPEKIPYGCRDAEFTLKWENDNVRLGLFVLDSSGTETFSNPDADTIIEGVEKGKTERTIKLKALGETSQNDNYKVCVYTMDNATNDIDFSIKYSWQQNITRKEGDIIASASEGAILASQLNAPLLYVKNNKLPKATKEALYKLGVENIHFINLKNCTHNKVGKELKEIANVKDYNTYRSIYDEIRDKTGNNDVIFSTVDPYSYFYGGEPKPAGENPGSLFIGPATLIAAHHGSPLLIVDNHPTLSQATVWHTQFWRQTSNISGRPKLPTVSCMVLTGRRVIDFLQNYGYDLPKQKDELASMITVAGQYDIGFPWDRTFTGRLIPGRFCFSPVDTAYQISRSVFYPALIFENPALQGTVTLTNGSKSKIQPYIGKLRYPKGTDIVVTKESKEEDFTYPVLHTYNVYQYKFNEIAPKAWGGKYTTANGITPGETPSNYPIDQGVVEGKIASYYPDIHESEVTPIYCEKAGYSNCFSTSFDKCVDNLNQGVLMWMESCHGHEKDYGGLSMWSIESPYVDEPNPWRAYDRIFASGRNWKELGNYFSSGYGYANRLPDIATKIAGVSLKLAGFVPNILLPDKGCTEEPDAEASNPYIVEGVPGLGPLIFDAFGWAPAQDKPLSRILSRVPILGRAFRVYGDGIVVNSGVAGGDVLKTYGGLDFDEKLENVHSCGLNACSCLAAGTYLHMAMTRHGCSYVILDPWTTSWYSSLWFQNIPRQLALGDTIGETYEKGMELVGAEYLIDHWWWDLNENVLFYGDPDLRVFTPNTEYSNANHWSVNDVQPLEYESDFSVEGHMTFGADHHPKAREPTTLLQEYLIPIISIIAIIVLLLIAMFINR